MDERSWDKFRASTLSSLNKAVQDKEVDPMLIDFLLEINKSNDIVSTSSCAGRIMVFIPDEKKNKTIRCFISHEAVTDEDIIAAIDACSSIIKERSLDKDIWIKVEPFIYHFVARDERSAKRIVDVCIKSGIKRCGMRHIRSGRYLVEIIGTNSIAFPLSFCQSFDVSVFVSIANNMLHLNELKRKRFEKAMVDEFI